MKERMKKFFIEKKELLIFIGVVVFVFAAVIGIASLAINSTNDMEDIPPVDNNQDDEPANTDTNDDINAVVEPKFSLPLLGDYNIARAYFDASLPKEALEAAVITDASGALLTSTGISYQKADNSSFEVLAIYDGTIVNVINDELAGATIEIDHGNNVISVYSSLRDVKIKLGDRVNQGAVIASASDSINDTDAKVHLHLQVKVNNEFINPDSVFGKIISEIIDMK